MLVLTNAGPRLEDAVHAAARCLPTLLPPGNEAIALACFSYTFSPALLQPYWQLAGQRIQALGCPAHELPTLEGLSKTLFQNRAADLLGLLAEKPAMQMKRGGKHRLVMIDGEGSLLPLRPDWDRSEVRPGFLMFPFACRINQRSCLQCYANSQE